MERRGKSNYNNTAILKFNGNALKTTAIRSSSDTNTTTTSAAASHGKMAGTTTTSSALGITFHNHKNLPAVVKGLNVHAPEKTFPKTTTTMTTRKVPPTLKDERKLFVGGLPPDSTFPI